jgi:hypothetical protein
VVGQFVEDGAEVAFAEQEHVVGAFAARGEHEAFGVGVGLRALRRGQEQLDALGGEIPPRSWR